MTRHNALWKRSQLTSGRSATPADINRNGRPTSIGTGGRHQSECPADIIGIRSEIEPKLIVILSDINMPGMDGLTLLDEVRRRFPDLPVMMVTAYGDNERRRRAGELGAAEFITKPVDFDQLKEQLRQLAAAADYRR